jgi:hypothetical protein
VVKDGKRLLQICKGAEAKKKKKKEWTNKDCLNGQGSNTTEEKKKPSEERRRGNWLDWASKAEAGPAPSFPSPASRSQLSGQAVRAGDSCYERMLDGRTFVERKEQRGCRQGRAKLSGVSRWAARVEGIQCGCCCWTQQGMAQWSRVAKDEKGAPMGFSSHFNRARRRRPCFLWLRFSKGRPAASR